MADRGEGRTEERTWASSAQLFHGPKPPVDDRLWLEVVPASLLAQEREKVKRAYKARDNAERSFQSAEKQRDEAEARAKEWRAPAHLDNRVDRTDPNCPVHGEQEQDESSSGMGEEMADWLRSESVQPKRCPRETP